MVIPYDYRNLRVSPKCLTKGWIRAYSWGEHRGGTLRFPWYEHLASLRGHYSILTQNNALPRDSSQNDHTIPFGLVSPIQTWAFANICEAKTKATFHTIEGSPVKTFQPNCRFVKPWCAPHWNHDLGWAPKLNLRKSMVIPQIAQLQLPKQTSTPNCVSTPTKRTCSILEASISVLGERGVKLSTNRKKFCNTRDLLTFLRGERKTKHETCLLKWGCKVGSRIATISQSWEWIKYIATVSTHTVKRTIPFSKELQRLGSFLENPIWPIQQCRVQYFPSRKFIQIYLVVATNWKDMLVKLDHLPTNRDETTRVFPKIVVP